MSEETRSPKVVVLGGGPGGYPAAFHAADLGMDVTLVDLEKNPGGVCLYRGCIPSKALLHVAKVMHEAKDAEHFGVTFGKPKLDLQKVRAWKDSVVDRNTGGLGQMRGIRNVKHVHGRGTFAGPNQLAVKTVDGEDVTVDFDYAIIATGSRPVDLPMFDNDSDRVLDSTTGLDLPDIPAKLLVVGGGYIGLEMGSVYSALGSNVTVVEMMPGLLPGADRNLVTFVQKKLEQEFDHILLNTKVVASKAGEHSVEVTFEDQDGEQRNETFDRVLVAVGRRPNSEDLGLEHTKVKVIERGFIEVDAQRRTAEPNIFCIGDVAGEPQLAHKATHEGLVAVEAIAGKKTVFAPHAIPAVVFTDPEIAWCGLTEDEAKAKGQTVNVSKFPWTASGRATAIERNDGLTKLIVDPATERILGVGITGVGAGDMIAEGVLAIEMGATVEDLQLTIHPHPTLSETMMEAADHYHGHSPHFYQKKR